MDILHLAAPCRNVPVTFTLYVMNSRPRPYPPTRVPPGFVYPEEFLRFLDSGETGNLYPWWLLDAESKAGDLFLDVVTELGKPLVPFAKTDDEDDIACFDAATTRGDPAVVMLTSTPDRSYGFKNFDEWLVKARRDAARLRGA